MLDDMLERANSVCLPALSRSDRRALGLLFVVLNGVVLCRACGACGTVVVSIVDTSI